MDQNLMWSYAAVDYCLRARAQDFKCYHEPGATVRLQGDEGERQAHALQTWLEIDREYFRKKWVEGLFNLLCRQRFYYPQDQQSLDLAAARIFGRRARDEGETRKAQDRRQREGFFEAYCQGRGLDIGYGGDLLSPNCIGWDIEHGDATFLVGLPDEEFDFVYSSHVLEDLERCDVGLLNWWRVLKPGGYLILFVPDRDLYEKKTELPSNWNPHHRHFFLLDRDELPDTLGLVPFIQQLIPDHEMVFAKQCSAGHTITDPTQHSDGEYSIEVVIRKPRA
jgi:predicted SAM-dependent methyltransferase